MIIWIGLFNAFKPSVQKKDVKGKKGIYSYCYYATVKYVCIVIMFLAYPVIVCVSYFNSSRNTSKEHLMFFLYLVFAVNLLVILCTLIYTLHLRYKLNQGYMNECKEQTFDVKVLGHDIKMNKAFFREKTKDGLPRHAVVDMKNFLHEIHKDNLIELVDELVRRNKEHVDDKQDSLDYSLDYRKEQSYLDDNMDVQGGSDELHHNIAADILMNPPSNNMLNGLNSISDVIPMKHQGNSFSNGFGSNLKKGSLIPSEDTHNNQSSMELTESDIKNLNKVFCLSYFIIGAQLIVIIIVLLSGFDIFADNPNIVISLLVIEFCAEITGFYCVYRLFVQDIKNVEYKNLRIIAQIERYTTKDVEDVNEKRILKFDFLEKKNVWKRFKSFVSMRGNHLIHNNNNTISKEHISQQKTINEDNNDNNTTQHHIVQRTDNKIKINDNSFEDEYNEIQSNEDKEVDR